MRYAIFLPIFGELSEPAVVARLSAQAEAAGWDGVFVWDHMAYRAPVVDIADPWVTLAAIACATETVRMGPMVTPPARRRPLKLCREVTTLDRLSGGRVTFGVGLGGDPGGELTALGEEIDPRARAQRFDEALTVMEAAWRGDPVHHHGPSFVVDGLTIGPRPVQQPRPPIWVAARYPNHPPLRRAARYEGLFPVQVQHADHLAELVTATLAYRASEAGPFDVAISFPAGTDPRPYAAAGATWWLVGFSPFDVTVAEVEAVARNGPPV